MDELLGQHVDLKKVRKIGEGESGVDGPPVAAADGRGRGRGQRLACRPRLGASMGAATGRRWKPDRQYCIALHSQAEQPPKLMPPKLMCLPPPPLHFPAGTFGEAFKAGGVVLKIVPMEGAVLVNGEPQKRADEILAEVSVTLTLSRLNGAAVAPGKGAGGCGGVGVICTALRCPWTV